MEPEPEPEPEPLEPLLPETEESSVGKEAVACLLRRPPEPELPESPEVLCSSLPLGPRCGFAVRLGREAELCEATAESRASDVCCGPALASGGALSTLTSTLASSILTSLAVTSCSAASPPEGCAGAAVTSSAVADGGAPGAAGAGTAVAVEELRSVGKPGTAVAGSTAAAAAETAAEPARGRAPWTTPWAARVAFCEKSAEMGGRSNRVLGTWVSGIDSRWP